MTWISTIPPEKAQGELKAAYEKLAHAFPPEYHDPVSRLMRPDGSCDSIVQSHSLLPQVMEPLFRALEELMSPKLPLTRRQHEIINTRVSALNWCHY